MHPVIAIANWSHHMHDGVVFLRHEANVMFHSRHFWGGVVIALLAAGLIALIFMLAINAPQEPLPIRPYGLPYGPYG